MVAADRKLAALASALTPRERAILQVRAWCAEEAPDDRMVRYCPPQDQAEFERIGEAITKVSNEFHAFMVIWFEWLAGLEAEIEFFRVLQLFSRRIGDLEQVAKKPLPPMPPPSRFRRLVPLGWGVLVDFDDPVPETWQAFLEQEAVTIHRSLALRWQDLLVTEAVLDELERTVGERLVHWAVEGWRADLRAHLERLTGIVGDLSHPFEVPQTDMQRLAEFRALFDWDLLRDTGDQKTPREWMHDAQYEELEAWEREQAESLRGGS